MCHNYKCVFILYKYMYCPFILGNDGLDVYIPSSSSSGTTTSRSYDAGYETDRRHMANSSVWVARGLS